MEYIPLNTHRNEIRLITILPPDAHPEEPKMIHCNLENVSLDEFTPEYGDFVNAVDSEMRRDLLLQKWTENRLDAFGLPREAKWSWTMVGRYTWTDYIALSYTWGDLGMTDTIFINGQPFEVTKNLHSALHQLRDSKYFATGVKLWVDAICINQKDTRERSLQVQRMRDIYSQAFNTFVWLGPEADNSTRAINLLDLFAKGGGMLKVEGPTQERPFTSSEAALWIALYKFLDRPYWKRVWILQEIIVSFSTLTIFCGERQLLLSDLKLAASSMGENFLAIKENIRHAYRFSGLSEPRVSIKVFLGRIMQLNLPFLDMIKSNDSRSLPMLLDLSRTSEQTDLKDKLYAILCLLDRNIACHITPNYELPLWKVFTSFPKAMITASGRLEILRQCSFEDLDDREVPSWVPNLTTIVHSNDMSLTAIYNACGNIPARFQFLQDDRGLQVIGFRIDSVDGLGCAFWDTIDSQSSITPPSAVANAYATEQAVRKALYRSLVAAGKEETGTDDSAWEQLLNLPASPPSWYDGDTKRDLESIHEFMNVNKGLQVCGRELGEWLSSNGSHGSHLEEPSTASKVSAFYSRILLVHTNRRLMTTSQGRVGVAPKAAENGDIICIFFGSSTPMIIRLIPGFENCFSLVGECYVDGVMDGEALDWLLTEKCQLENFVLC